MPGEPRENDRHAGELEALIEVSRLATDPGDLRARLQRIADVLRLRFGWDLVTCHSVDEESRVTVTEAVSTELHTDSLPGYTMPLRDGVIGEVARSGKPILLDDVRDAGASGRYVEMTEGTRAELCVPVSFSGKVLAVLNLESRQVGAFRGQLPLLEAVARQIGGAIHLSNLNRELEATNARLREANERALRLVSAPQTAEDLPVWTRSASVELMSMLDATDVGVFRVDGASITLLGGRGEAPTDEEIAELKAGAGLLPGHDRLLVPASGFDGGLLGVISIHGGHLRFGESEFRILGLFARQLADVLERSRLRDELAAAERARAASRRLRALPGVDTLMVCRQCGRCYDPRAERCAADGTRLEDASPTPLVIADRYRLLRQLGQGGMGTVYLARDRQLDRDVAVKLIRPEHLSNEGMRERIKREALVIAKIQHPNVVALYHSDELADGSTFLVMERLRGRTLEQILDEHGTGSPRQVARVIRQAAHALTAAHNAGVVHRDVKPQNLFIVEGGDGFAVKVLDFGLSLSVSSEDRITQHGMIVGTPAYMSPEQAQGRFLDARSDLYSLATVAYEALTGKRAIPGDDPARVLANVLEKMPRPVSSIVPHVPFELDDAFARAFAKDPEERPWNLEGWATRTAAALERLPTSAPGWPAEIGTSSWFALSSDGASDTTAVGAKPWMPD